MLEIIKLILQKTNGKSNGKDVSEIKDYESNPSFKLNETVDDNIISIRKIL